MKRWLPLAVASGVLAAACSESRTPTQVSTPEFQEIQNGSATSHIHILPTRAQARPGGGSGGKGTGIFYHGGPIITAQNVAAIYWSGATIYNGGPTPGSTGSGAQDGSLVGFFLRSLGGSPYFNINTTYFDGAGTHVQNVVNYTQFWAANTNVPASGSTVSDAQVQAQVISGFTSGRLTFDAATLYAVFSGPGVNLGGGFGTSYCAYHGHFNWNGNDVKYAVMPYDADFVSGCTALSGSPNNDFAADAEVNTLAHETEETTTDPDLNAWFDRRGQENADKCAWTFGATYSTSNGSTANMNLGGKDFLVQRNWVNAGSGGCLVGYP
jgi:phosphate-induced protein 1